MQAILRRLLDRLDAIAEQHGEVGDTDFREAISDAVFDGFLRPVSAFALPDRYAMLSDEGDLLVKRALARSNFPLTRREPLRELHLYRIRKKFIRKAPEFIGNSLG